MIWYIMEGDLTQTLDVHTGDEMEVIAENVNGLLQHIREIMLNISQNSEYLKDSSIRCQASWNMAIQRLPTFPLRWKR